MPTGWLKVLPVDQMDPAFPQIFSLFVIPIWKSIKCQITVLLLLLKQFGTQQVKPPGPSRLSRVFLGPSSVCGDANILYAASLLIQMPVLEF